MEAEDYFPVVKLCDIYSLETSFFEALGEYGLIEYNTHQGQYFIHQDSLYEVERIIRIHRDLNVNLEGIDVVLNILKRQEYLERELLKMKNRLRRYEGEQTNRFMDPTLPDN
jgi:hypothetical protein